MVVGNPGSPERSTLRSGVLFFGWVRATPVARLLTLMWRSTRSKDHDASLEWRAASGRLGTAQVGTTVVAQRMLLPLIC